MEFETGVLGANVAAVFVCKFTPMEFETTHMGGYEDEISV